MEHSIQKRYRLQEKRFAKALPKINSQCSQPNDLSGITSKSSILILGSLQLLKRNLRSGTQHSSLKTDLFLFFFVVDKFRSSSGEKSYQCKICISFFFPLFRTAVEGCTKAQSKIQCPIQSSNIHSLIK